MAIQGSLSGLIFHGDLYWRLSSVWCTITALKCGEQLKKAKSSVTHDHGDHDFGEERWQRPGAPVPGLQVPDHSSLTIPAAPCSAPQAFKAMQMWVEL